MTTAPNSAILDSVTNPVPVSYTHLNNYPETILSAAVEGKNRPVATNFQFLKMLCSTGTSLLQCVCISEVILLVRACPKPCSSFVPSGTNGTACRALHNFTEELSNTQEVQ